MHRIDHSVPLFFTRVRGTRIPITPQLVADVLRVPRVEFFDYPSCEHLRTMSKDELKSAFCEHPSEWGKHQFTYCLGFSKGPRFLNMVITFVLYPLSHYNSSLVLGFCCSFLSILLLISFLISFCLLQMFIWIRRLVISSSFLPLSRGYYTIFPSLFLCPTTSLIFVPQITLPLNVVRLSSVRDRQIHQFLSPVRLHLDLLNPHPLLPLPRAMCHQETSWRSFSAWMLAQIHSLQSCIR